MKGLEALNNVRESLINVCSYIQGKDPNAFIECNHDIKRYVEVNYICDIEKELKALEIIRNKKVAYLLIWLMERHTKKSALRLYNEPCDEDRKLTEEEYDLLKEVLKDD